MAKPADDTPRMKFRLKAGGNSYKTELPLSSRGKWNAWKSAMILRKFTLQDAPRVVRLVGDEDVSKWTTNIPFPYSERHAVN